MMMKTEKIVLKTEMFDIWENMYQTVYHEWCLKGIQQHGHMI